MHHALALRTRIKTPLPRGRSTEFILSTFGRFGSDEAIIRSIVGSCERFADG